MDKDARQCKVVPNKSSENSFISWVGGWSVELPDANNNVKAIVETTNWNFLEFAIFAKDESETGVSAKYW